MNETEQLVNDMFKEMVLDNPVESDTIEALKYLAGRIDADRVRFYTPGIKMKVDGKYMETEENPVSHLSSFGNLRPFKAEIYRHMFTQIMEEGGFSPKSTIYDLINMNIAKDTTARFRPDKTPASCIVIDLRGLCSKI